MENNNKTLEELQESVKKAKASDKIDNEEIQERFEMDDEFYCECINDPEVEIIDEEDII